jgi:uncharacterized membrane protein
MVTSQHNAGIFLPINYYFNKKNSNLQYRRVNGLERKKVGHEEHYITRNLVIYTVVQPIYVTVVVVRSLYRLTCSLHCSPNIASVAEFRSLVYNLWENNWKTENGYNRIILNRF